MQTLRIPDFNEVSGEMECPNCPGSNWRVDGQMGQLADNMYCPVCLRRWQRMTPVEAVAYFAEDVAIAARDRHSDLLAAYDRLIDAYLDYRAPGQPRDRMVLIFKGTPPSDADDNDTPF